MRVINKGFGFLRRQKPVDNNKISTGLNSLDKMFGGGIIPGSIIEVFGWEDVGKTTLALQIAQSVKRQKPDEEVIFLDFDKNLDPQYALQILKGQDVLFFSTGDIESAKKILDYLGEYLIKPSLIILDSVVNIPDELYCIMRFLSKIKQKNSDSVIIFINQKRISMLGLETTWFWDFFFFIPHLRLEIIKEKVDKDGFVCKFVLDKNKFLLPYDNRIFYFKFQQGFING